MTWPTAPLMAAYGVTPWRGVLGQGVALADLAPSDEHIRQKVAAALARFQVTPATLAERLLNRAGIATP